MSTSKHTPAPWRIQPLPTNVWNVTHHVEAKGEMLPVAMVHGEANASLIAAAPDLLAALQIAEATLQRLAPDGSRATQGTRDVIAAARSKALGK